MDITIAAMFKRFFFHSKISLIAAVSGGGGAGRACFCSGSGGGGIELGSVVGGGEGYSVVFKSDDITFEN